MHREHPSSPEDADFTEQLVNTESGLNGHAAVNPVINRSLHAGVGWGNFSRNIDALAPLPTYEASVQETYAQKDDQREKILRDSDPDAVRRYDDIVARFNENLDDIKAELKKGNTEPFRKLYNEFMRLLHKREI